MADASPAHVGDMEQPIQTVEVDERAEVGDVLDGALADVARRHFSQELLPSFGALLFDQLAPRKDDVLAFLIDFDNLELVRVTDESGEILGRDDVDLRGR